MSGTVKKVLAGVVLFVSGLIVGVFGSRLFSERGTLAMLHGDTRQFADMALHRLGRDLDLSRDQMEKLRPMFYETARKLAAIRREQEPKIQEAMDQDLKAVKDLLTPEQREKFEAVLKHLRERRAAMERFGPPPPPPGLGPPNGPPPPPPGLGPPPDGPPPDLGLGPPPGGPGFGPPPPPHGGHPRHDPGRGEQTEKDGAI